jgi:hypothetical protein
MSEQAESYCLIPSGVAADPPSTGCNGAFILLIPFLLNGILGLGAMILAGRRKARDKIRFWDQYYLYDEDDVGKWTPWAAVGSAVGSVVVAVVSVVLLRVGGLQIQIGPAILFWLTRPRVTWVVIMLSSVLHKQLFETATDLLFQECIIAVLAIPASVQILTVTVGGTVVEGCEDPAFYRYNDSIFNTGGILELYWGGAVGLIVCGSILLFIGVTMLWRLKFLGPVFAILGGLICMSAFVSSWLLWIGMYMQLCTRKLIC